MNQNIKISQSRKGFALPMLLAIVALLAIGGGYAIVKTNPGVAQKLGFEKQVEKKDVVADQKGEKVKLLGFCYDFSVDLKEGARGNNVGALSQILVKEKLMADPEEPLSLTVFYKETTVAVTKFQTKYSIKQTGIVDSDTRLQLNKLYGCVVGGTSDWKTYTNEKFGFEIKYPANYFIHDYGVTPKNTTFTAAVLAIADSKKTYESGGAKIVVYVSSLPVAAFKDSEEYIKYMRPSYPSLKKIAVTKEDVLDLSGTEGIQFFGTQKDSAGKVENIQSILGYSNKIGYEVVAYSSDFPLFSTILSTFEFISPVTTATADWKTYKNEKYGFEVQYPAQWEIGKSSVKNNHPENSTSFMTLIMAYIKEPEINVSVNTEKAQNAVAKIQKIINTKFSYDSSVSEVAKDTSKESSRYQVYNFTNPNGVKVYSYSFVGKYSETSRHFFFDTANATIVFSVTSNVSCAKGCAFATENEAFLAVPALRHWIDSITLSAREQSSNWKTYKNEKYGFEVQYPSVLSVKQEGETITLRHSIVYTHPNPCDFKGDGAPPLERLADFGVSLKVVSKNLKELLQSTEYPGWDYVSKNPFKSGSLSGFKIMEGIEGCGKDVYYLTLSPTKTLIIDRSLITEFTTVGDSQKYLSLPGIIPPNQGEEFFTKILSTFKFISPSTTATSNWKTYTNSKYGFEISYPTSDRLTSLRIKPEVTAELETKTAACRSNQGMIDAKLQVINGISFYMELLQANGGTQSGEFVSDYTTVKNGLCYQLLFRIGGGNRTITSDSTEIKDASNIVDQIVRTFKFISPSTTSTSGWKTYTSEKYGFVFKYPADLVDADLGVRGYYDHLVDPDFTVVKRLEMPGSQKIIGSGEKIAGMLQISVATSSSAVSACLTARSPDELNNTSNVANITMNGSQFAKYDSSSSDLGNRFGERVFSAVKNNTCYRIEIIESGIGFSVGPNVNQQTSSAEAMKWSLPFSAYDVFARLTPVAYTFSFISRAATNENKVVATARKVLEALAARNYQTLEGLVSPDGLSLHQEPSLDFTKKSVAKNDVSEIPKDAKVYMWGYTDGKGDPINLTVAEFFARYIYSGTVDYLKAPDVAVNKTLGGGNSVNTIDKDVNGRTYVAFHFDGFDSQYGGMDWTTIYLVFDTVNGEYKLRGIAKDNWTI